MSRHLSAKIEKTSIVAVVLLSCAITVQAQVIDVAAAWYGRDDMLKNSVMVTEKVQDNVFENDGLYFNDMNGLFGDPIPNKEKVIAVAFSIPGMTVVSGGKDFVDVRIEEGTEIACPAVDIMGAWYGLEKGAKTTDGVADMLVTIMDRYGYLKIPADMDTLFGGDPAPNKAKLLAIRFGIPGASILTVEPAKNLIHIRIPEGEFGWYIPAKKGKK